VHELVAQLLVGEPGPVLVAGFDQLREDVVAVRTSSPPARYFGQDQAIELS
jgi:hypothetical protein